VEFGAAVDGRRLRDLLTVGKISVELKAGRVATDG
jgi:hypothetical protein